MDNERARWGRLAAAWGAALLVACGGGGGSSGACMAGYGMTCPAAGGGGTAMSYAVTALVSDASATPSVDPNLIEPWGVAFNPQGFVWVSNAGTSTSTLYDGNGVAQSLVVSLPPGQAGPGAPTGIVFNDTTDFAVSQAGVSGASAFIFVGANGTLAGWLPGVNATTAVTVFDGAAAAKLYTAAALATQGGANFLYATDFHNGHVDVFDAAFHPVVAAGGFVDPSLPAGYAPFGIQAVGANLIVTYAKQGAAAHAPVAAAGLGVVDQFDSAGHLLRQLVGAGGALDAPWGVALAPANFGPFSGALLIGNNGDGKINAFDPTAGTMLGTLSQADGSAIVVSGLLGIEFGNGINAQPTNTLFFAAAPAAGAHGLYGRIDNR